MVNRVTTTKSTVSREYSAVSRVKTTDDTEPALSSHNLCHPIYPFHSCFPGFVSHGCGRRWTRLSASSPDCSLNKGYPAPRAWKRSPGTPRLGENSLSRYVAGGTKISFHIILRCPPIVCVVSKFLCSTARIERARKVRCVLSKTSRQSG